jgi:hypothetical protein
LKVDVFERFKVLEALIDTTHHHNRVGIAAIARHLCCIGEDLLIHR